MKICNLLIINDRRFYKIREYKSNIPLLFVVAGISVSILVWCALYPELNSRQIHQNLSIPLLNVVFAIYTVNFLNKNYSPVISGNALKNVTKIFLLILIMQNLFTTIHFATDKRSQTHSAEYLSQVKNNLLDNTFVASLKSESKEEVNSKFNFGYTLGDYLFLMNENINPVNIGDLNFLIDSSSTLNCQFPENIKMKKDEVMLKFLKEYRIEQMIVSKNAIIPDTLMHFVDEIITDSVSGERFVGVYVR